MQLKDQISIARHRSGLSLKDLAGRVGVSETAVRSWEAGRTRPRRSAHSRIEEVLGVELDWVERVVRSGDAVVYQEAEEHLMRDILRLAAPKRRLIEELVSSLLSGHAEPATQTRSAPITAAAPLNNAQTYTALSGASVASSTDSSSAR